MSELEMSDLGVGSRVRINKPSSLFHDIPAEIIHFYVLGKSEPKRVLLRLNAGGIRSEWLRDLLLDKEE